MNISPSRVIPVSYSVLPTDVGPYFVQAVLRDTATGNILQTINLVQNPTYLYRYTGQFKPVSDPSGLGRYIDITIIPYTDSGHTTPSQNYAALQLNYNVLQPWIPTLGSGGGSNGVDYEKIENIVLAIVEGRKPKLEGLEKIEYKRIWDMVEESRSSLLKEISENHAKGIDGVTSLLSELKEHLAGMSENMSNDASAYHSSLINRIENIHSSLHAKNVENHSEVKESIRGLADMNARNHRKLHDNLKDTVGNIAKDVKKSMSQKDVKLYFKDDKTQLPFTVKQQDSEESTQKGYDMESLKSLLS